MTKTFPLSDPNGLAYKQLRKKNIKLKEISGVWVDILKWDFYKINEKGVAVKL